MVLVVVLCLGLLALLLTRHFLNIRKARWMLPAGPVPLPFIGNLGTLGFQIHPEALLKLASVYGDMYTLWLGQNPVIVLSGFQTVKEVLIDHSEDFSDRPLLPFFERAMSNAQGIIFSNGYVWKQQRRFCLMTLRNLGLGRRSLENFIQQEASHLVQAIGQEKGRPMDPHDHILLTVSNVISSMLFGHGISREVFHNLTKSFKNFKELSGSFWPQLYDTFPALMKHLHPQLNKLLAGLLHWEKFLRLVAEEVEHHRRSRSPEEHRDFIDAYLAQLEKMNTTEKSNGNPAFTEPNMLQVVADIFIAGADTTTTALCWALLYMITYPEIQEQVQEELDAVLGPSRVICYEDRAILPFTNAVLHETQRLSSITAVGVMRTCSNTTTIRGMRISKGTIVFPNMLSVNYDPEHWETPRKFNPGHFLDKDGNFVNKQAFLPFSGGARVCLGEKLARTALFILFTNLLRAFRFQLPEGVKEINKEPVLSLTLQNHPYKTCAVPR